MRCRFCGRRISKFIVGWKHIYWGWEPHAYHVARPPKSWDES